MQLIFSDRYYDTPEYEEGKFARDLSDELVKAGYDVEAHEAQIGHGADFPVVLVELLTQVDWSSLFTAVGGGSLLLGGDRLNKSLDGWIEIGRKVKSLLTQLQPTIIDEYAAAMVALDDMAKRASHDPSSMVLQIEDFKATPWNDHRLSKRPYALYTISIRAGSELYIYGISSNGGIEFRHQAGASMGEVEVKE